MAHVLQVGAGSGGMPVLDLLSRDARISREGILVKRNSELRRFTNCLGAGCTKMNAPCL